MIGRSPESADPGRQGKDGEEAEEPEEDVQQPVRQPGGVGIDDAPGLGGDAQSAPQGLPGEDGDPQEEGGDGQQEREEGGSPDPGPEEGGDRVVGQGHLPNRGQHIFGGKVAGFEPARVQPDPHAVVALGENRHLADALDSTEGIAQPQGGIVGQV